MNNTITVIIPVHKFEFIQNSIDNFERQNYANKQLVFVKNSELLDYNIGSGTELSIDSKNIAEIRNIGLDWMNLNNLSIFAYMDSDDYYSDNYLSEAYNKLIDGYDIVGKLDYKFKFKDDLYEILGLKDNMIHGPTMFGYLSNKRFDLRFHNLAEDIDFIQRHSKIGHTSSDNFIYNVREDSIQKRSFVSFLESMKFSASSKKLENVTITKNNNVIWKYGDGFEIEKLLRGLNFNH